MNCLQFRQSLDELVDGTLDVDAETACLAHAHACATCARLHAGALEVQQALRALPAPVPAPGFAERMLAGVRAAQPTAADPSFPPRRHWAGAGALAAGVIVALALGAWLPGARLPKVEAGGQEPLRLVFRSQNEVVGVTIELDLPEGVELSGYPGQRRLVWQSDLLPGENLLELPVRAGGKGGVVTATLNLGSERRQFSVRVVPAREARRHV